MCLNSGGEKWQRTKFFFKNFLEGGENDKGGKMTEGITVFEISLTFVSLYEGFDFKLSIFLFEETLFLNFYNLFISIFIGVDTESATFWFLSVLYSCYIMIILIWIILSNNRMINISQVFINKFIITSKNYSIFDWWRIFIMSITFT